MDATNLLLSHINDTFVTPVFNGSASLRDAAGALIENVNKSVRRGQTVDAEYMEDLQADVLSLYRLNQSREVNGGLPELGKMPTASVILLSSLAGVWCLIGLYMLREKIKKSGK